MNLRLTASAAVATVLASVAMYPLLSSWRWFWIGAGGAAVIAAIGAATRVRTFPAAVCFLATLAGGFLYLNAVFAGGRSWAGLVPTHASLHRLGQLVSQASSDMSRFAPPVPPRPGIMLMTTAGICLVAIITDLVAVRLRRPALAGLPLLVLFCVPLTTSAHPSWFGATVVFCLGMAGYLGLLSADGRDRLRLWGRLVHRWADESEGRSPDTRPLMAAGRRLGSTAVVIAICIPLLVPGLKVHRIFAHGKGTGPAGSHGQIALPNPVAELGKQLHETPAQVVMTYRTAASTPPYLQVYVLSQLGTDAWTMAPPASTTALGKGNLPAVPGLARGTRGVTVHESINISPSVTTGRANVSYLPLPYPARTVAVSGDWRVDPAALTVLAPRARLGGLRYAVTTYDVSPLAEQLRQAPAPTGMDRYLAVPQGFDKLKPLAERITKSRTTDFGKAVELQNWFTRPGNFTYSPNVPPARSADALAQFLEHSRRGYCQQFAFAMAVLARLLGIPSRVVVGYTQGHYVVNNAWQVLTSDAHAWPELYFPGAGWLRFEPTPTGSGSHPGQSTATAPIYTIPASAAPGLGGGSVLPAPGDIGGRRPANAGLPAGVHFKPAGPEGTAGRGGHHGSSFPVAALVLALLGAMVIAPRAARSATRRWRWWRARDDLLRAHTAWRELRDDLTDHRIACRASESPRSLARRLAEMLDLTGAERHALERVALAEERASYASSPARDCATLPRDVAMVRRAMGRAAGLQGRMAALLLPFSALAPVRAALQQALDVFGWMDVVTTRLRGRAGRRRRTVALTWRS